jgi:parvulin-like peptidyl-prolyl isomerase
MPRLLNRSRASDANPARGRPPASLPPYQPASCPLNDSARRALGELSNNRGNHAYQTQLKDSVRHLGLSVGDLHERLQAQQERLQLLQKRRQEKGTCKTAEEERLQEHVLDFEKEVDELTHESEISIRDVIDHKVALEDQAAVLADLYTDAVTAATANESRARTRRGQELQDEAQSGNRNPEQEEDQKDEPVASMLDLFREARARKQSEYEQLTLHQRYGLNNDYAGFKKIWHDAAAGEDGPPLPDASRWFRSNGRPVMTIAGANTRRSTMGPVEDDDIAVAREVLSLNCPLTLRQMEEPYSNIKCKHTFEKSSILDYLSQGREVQCPQTGCSQVSARIFLTTAWCPIFRAGGGGF